MMDKLTEHHCSRLHPHRSTFMVGAILFAWATCFHTPVGAEVIQIPVGQQAPELRDLPRPSRGMSQDAVLARFGEPLSLTRPVGQPPISKWHYADFTVYFESAVVIHSVLTHKPKYPELLNE